MEEQKYLEDLKEIRQIMQKSSRFLSLSGLSGVVAGVTALAGALVAYRMVYQNQDFEVYRSVDMTSDTLLSLILIAVCTIVIAAGAAIYFTTRKAHKENEPIWDSQAKRLVTNLLIPLAAGGILSVILLVRGYVGLVAPITLIFYGMALVNASKYTVGEIRSLGIIEIVLGLMAAWYVGYGLLFWSVGFGVFHIIYGFIMQRRYGS